MSDLLETILLNVLVAGARDATIAARLLGLDAPEGYFYVFGAASAAASNREWEIGLWER